MACVEDPDCPPLEVCYDEEVLWVKAVNGSARCGCNYWHGKYLIACFANAELTQLLGATRDENGICVGFAIGAYYLIADCLFQLAICFVGVAVAIWLISQKYCSTRNGLTCVIASLLCCTSFAINRGLMLTQALTPEDHTYCCNLVYGRRRREHELRIPEIIFFLCGAAWAEVAVFVMILSWLRTAEVLEREAGIANVISVRRYKGYLWMMALIILITLIIVYSVNTGLSGAIGIAFAASSVVTLVHIVRRIRKWKIPLSGGSAERNGIALSPEAVRARTFFRVLFIISAQICAAMGCLFISSCIYLYTALLPRDWKSASPPDEISISLFSTNGMVFGIVLPALSVEYAVYKGHIINERYKSDRIRADADRHEAGRVKTRSAVAKDESMYEPSEVALT